MDLQALENQFKTLFGKTPEYAHFAPGRVNLIGDHTDYNGGLVFPCALSFGTYLLAAQRDDRHNAFRSLNFEYAGTTDATAFSNKPKEWIAYPLGVMEEFADLGHPVWGYDLLYYGNIPNGFLPPPPSKW